MGGGVGDLDAASMATPLKAGILPAAVPCLLISNTAAKNKSSSSIP